MDYSVDVPQTVTVEEKLNHWSLNTTKQPAKNPGEYHKILKHLNVGTLDTPGNEVEYKLFLRKVSELGYKLMRQTRDDGVKFEVY